MAGSFGWFGETLALPALSLLVGVGSSRSVEPTTVAPSPSSSAKASSACWGTTPFPRTFNWALRGMSTPVTQSSGSPCIHSTNLGDSRGRPFWPGSVGGGAGLPSTCSQRAMAAAYGPKSDSAASRSCAYPPGVRARCSAIFSGDFAPSASDVFGVGSSRCASISSGLPCPLPCLAHIASVHSSHASGVLPAPMSFTAGVGSSAACTSS